MFRPTAEQGEKAWSFYEDLTLLSHYESLHRIIRFSYSRYKDLVERYSRATGRPVRLITPTEPGFAERNVRLLINAVELWRTASRSIEAVAPVLYHYSLHCFNSFFAYTFFGWDPEHARGHGIRTDLQDNIENIDVVFYRDGLFRRFVDTWTLLGASVAFSDFIPTFENDEISFTRNNWAWLRGSKKLSVGELMRLDSNKFVEQLCSDGTLKLVSGPVYSNNLWSKVATAALKSYVVLFVASNLARYRPTIWDSVVAGKSFAQSHFRQLWAAALRDYISGRKGRGGVLQDISVLFRNLLSGTFKLEKAI